MAGELKPAPADKGKGKGKVAQKRKRKEPSRSPSPVPVPSEVSSKPQRKQPKVSNPTLYNAVKTVYELKAKELDDALSTLVETRKGLMSVLFVRPEGVVIAEDMRGLKEKGREDKAGKQIDVTILEEEGKTRMLLSDHEKDVTLLRLDDMITKLRHEDAVAALRKVALELVDASFD